MLNAVVEPVYADALNESRYFNPSGAICYYDGEWHDSAGNVIAMSDTEESDICADMADMERINYASMPDYIMLEGYETIDDIAEEYLGCSADDAFVYYYGTGSGGVHDKRFKYVSPVSQLLNFQIRFTCLHRLMIFQI